MNMRRVSQYHVALVAQQSIAVPIVAGLCRRLHRHEYLLPGLGLIGVVHGVSATVVTHDARLLTHVAEVLRDVSVLQLHASDLLLHLGVHNAVVAVLGLGAFWLVARRVHVLLALLLQGVRVIFIIYGGRILLLWNMRVHDMLLGSLVHHALRSFVSSDAIVEQECRVSFDLGVIELRLDVVLLADEVVVELSCRHVGLVSGDHLEIVHFLGIIMLPVLNRRLHSVCLLVQNLVVESHVLSFLGDVLVGRDEVIEVLLLVLGLTHYRP